MGTFIGATASSPTKMPYEAGHWLWGVLPEFRQRPAETLGRLLRRYPEVVRVRFGLLSPTMVNHPEIARDVLRQDVKAYHPLPYFYDIVRQVAGLNLFTAEGDYWRQQRALMQPTFHRKNLAPLAVTITEEAEALAQAWEKKAKTGEWVDVKRAMLDMTLNLIGRTLFSIDLLRSAEGRRLSRALTFGGQYIPYRVENPLALPRFVPTRRNVDYWRARWDAQRIVQGLIEARRRMSHPPHDFLQLLMEARYADTGETMTDEQLVDEARTFFFAGHESSGMTLSFTLYHIARNPHIQARLQAEWATVLGGRTPTLQDLPQLKYTELVVQEATRLYPPGWLLLRETLEETQVGGYTLKAGEPLILVTYNIQRHPDFWVKPHLFYPERYEDAEQARLARRAYLAFGAGPRNCIGMNFAMMEAQLILPTLLQRVTLQLADDYVAPLHFVFPLGIEGALPMRIGKKGREQGAV